MRQLWALCWLAVLVASPATSAASKHKVYLTAKEQAGAPVAEPATQFSCGDKIYAVLEISGLSREKHRLDAVWRDPYGKDREHTEYEFQVHSDFERIWVWLKLHRSGEAALVSFLNPSAGMEEFIGEWEIRLSLDNSPLENKKFSVLC